ncbi:MAG TPA: hypothetical protein DEH11_17985, partial [Actinobacteria bacterium]|nr:hypothetical protein [Actinomycetota bacterium]
VVLRNGPVVQRAGRAIQREEPVIAPGIIVARLLNGRKRREMAEFRFLRAAGRDIIRGQPFRWQP